VDEFVHLFNFIISSEGKAMLSECLTLMPAQRPVTLSICTRAATRNAKKREKTCISVNRRQFSGATATRALCALGIKRCSLGEYGQGAHHHLFIHTCSGFSTHVCWPQNAAYSATSGTHCSESLLWQLTCSLSTDLRPFCDVQRLPSRT